jgi:hypothetical protein
MRDFPSGRHVFFYHVVTNAIEIVRVLHGGRHIESVFEGHAKHPDPSSRCQLHPSETVEEFFVVGRSAGLI